MFRRKRTPRKKPGHILILGILTVAIGYGLVRSGGSVLTIWRLSRDRHEEIRLLREEEARKRTLEQEITRLESDSSYIEDIARREYGMIKDGEEVYRLPSAPTESKRDAR